MSENNVKKKKQKKPVRLSKHWGMNVLPMARRMIPMVVLIVIMGLLFTALQAISLYWLRVVLSVAGVAAAALLLYYDGMNSGVLDVNASRAYMQAQADGRTLTDREDAACYHPLKALCAVLVIFGIPMVLSVYMAFNAKDYTYTLQTLPTWLTQSYGTREDVMAPLGAYAQAVSMTIADGLRIIVRLFILTMVNLFEDPQKMTGMIDRLSPVMMLVLPMAYLLGYLCGPNRAQKISKLNRRAKKVAVRRAERRKVGPELLGMQNQVHYGHQKEEKARKKKDLI